MKPGTYQISMSEYLSLVALSSGLCHTLLTYSPHHAKHEQDNRSDDGSSEADFGTAVHDVLLEGRDRIVTVDAPDWRTKAAKEQRDGARLAGMIPLLAHKVEAVYAAVKAAQEFVAGSEIAGVFDSGKAEQTVLWQEDGMLCKSRPDWLNDDWHISVKTTTGSANPSHYTRFIMSQQGHDTGLAFYRRGLEALGVNVEHRVLLIEQEPPHGCCVFGLAPSKWEYTQSKITRAIGAWQRCVASGRYPAYPSETCFAEAMPYEIAAEEELNLSDAYDALQGAHGLQT